MAGVFAEQRTIDMLILEVEPTPAPDPIVLEPMTPVGPPIRTMLIDEIGIGLSAAELADLQGLSPGSIDVLAHEGTNVNIAELWELAAATGHDIVLRVDE